MKVVCKNPGSMRCRATQGRRKKKYITGHRKEANSLFSMLMVIKSNLCTQKKVR